MGGGGFLRVPFLHLKRTTGGTFTMNVHTKYIVSKEHVEYTLSIDTILREMLNPLASFMFYPDDDINSEYDSKATFIHHEG